MQCLRLRRTASSIHIYLLQWLIPSGSNLPYGPIINLHSGGNIWWMWVIRHMSKDYWLFCWRASARKLCRSRGNLSYNRYSAQDLSSITNPSSRASQQMTGSIYQRQDLCNLKHPGARTDEVEESRRQGCLPQDLRYACRYWVEHLRRCEIGVVDNSLVYRFLRKHLLHWFEALSWMKAALEGIQILTALQFLVTVSALGRLNSIYECWLKSLL